MTRAEILEALPDLTDEELDALIRTGARICDVGGWAVAGAVKAGVPEHEVAIAGTNAMIREIANSFPFVELMDTWTWFQSGINTDGAHNPVTSRRIERGDILSLNCFPMVAGYYVALERTLFAETATAENLRLWEINCAVHDRGKALLVPGARCSDIARELNDIYASHGLLDYRSYRTETARWHSLQWSPLESDPGLYGDGDVLYYWLWPNTMLNLLPGRLKTNRVLPLGADRCRVLGPWVVVGDHDEVCAARGHLAHQRPLGRVSVAARADDAVLGDGGDARQLGRIAHTATWALIAGSAS